MKKTDYETNTIDFTSKLLDIKKRYGERYFCNEDAMKEAADFWGADHNPHGVIKSTFNETVVKTGNCEGEIEFAKTKKGYWLIGLSGQSAMNGFGYAPSIWDRIGFKTQYDARQASILRLIDFFSKVAADNISTNSAKNKADAKQAIRLLQDAKTPQLTLF